MPTDDTVLHITFKRDPLREQHIRDAKRVDDWPEDELHEVVVDPDEITVEGTPEGIRWLYDMLHQLARDWRQEGEQWDADAAEDMARTIWEAVDDDLPDQQRTRRLTDGGQSESGSIERLQDELRERRHLEYVEVRRAETGEVVVTNTAPESSHFNNAELAAIYEAGFYPNHIECGKGEVWLREQS